MAGEPGRGWGAGSVVHLGDTERLFGVRPPRSVRLRGQNIQEMFVVDTLPGLFLFCFSRHTRGVRSSPRLLGRHRKRQPTPGKED